MPTPEENLPELHTTAPTEIALDRRTFLTGASALLLIPTLAEGQTHT